MGEPTLKKSLTKIQLRANPADEKASISPNTKVTPRQASKSFSVRCLPNRNQIDLNGYTKGIPSAVAFWPVRTITSPICFSPVIARHCIRWIRDCSRDTRFKRTAFYMKARCHAGIEPFFVSASDNAKTLHGLVAVCWFSGNWKLTNSSEHNLLASVAV